MKKIDKTNVIKFLIILTISLLFCHNFLQMHYSSDTYVLIDLGYMEYPSQYFLLDGRLISTLVLYLAGIMHIPIPIYIVGMDFIGIILISTSIYLMDKILGNIINPNKNIIKIMITASCFILILNQFTLEYLLFPESGVMCLGVLLNVFAIKIMIEKSKHKYMKIFVTLLIAALCYQGLLNMFPVLAVLVYTVKIIVDKEKYKFKEKEFFMEMIKLAIIIIIVLILCMVVIKIGVTLLNSNQNRMMNIESFEDVKLILKYIIVYVDKLWNNSMNMLPTNINNIILFITLFLLMQFKAKKEIIMQYILFLIISFTIWVIPMFLFQIGVNGRVNEPLAMIWGASLIILLAQSSIAQKENKFEIQVVYFVIIISFIINNLFIMQNTTEHIAANRVDENTGKTIKYALEKYERETGNKITKFSYAYDKNSQRYSVGIKQIGSLTERKFACPWCIKQAMNFYCERKFEEVKMLDDNIVLEEMLKKDYTEFSEEQLVFIEDTLHMVIY